MSCIKDASVNNGASLDLVADSGATGDCYGVVSHGEGSHSVTRSK